ncbi:MAG: HEAT repeat domain-containing protein, partial [Elusimicrobia bacterium]|nr:HEAT repeat domain-containing protein [Elusimicrobiota bacterium]
MVCDALVERGTAVVEEVGKAASDPRWFVVRNAAVVLGRVGGPRACEFLGKTLSHKSHSVRREAVEALARMETPEARAALRAALHDPDPRLRLRALGALARGGRPEDAERVEARVLAADFRLLPPDEQREWLETLAGLRGDASLPVFRSLIRKRLFSWGARRRLRAIAAFALGSSDGAASKAYLETLARVRDRSVREAAEAALERLSRRAGGGHA